MDKDVARKRAGSAFAKTKHRASVFGTKAVLHEGEWPPIFAWFLCVLIRARAGFLKKHSTGIMKRWQARWFAVSGHYLKYYEDDTKSDKKLKGTIDLTHLQAVGQTLVVGEIQLIIAGDTVLLRAESEADAAKCVSSLSPRLLLTKSRAHTNMPRRVLAATGGQTR